MKKLLLACSLCFAFISSYAQEIKSDTDPKPLTNFEVQLQRGGFLPNLGFNYYLREHLIFRIDAEELTRGLLSASNQNIFNPRITLFLEMRKPRENSNWFFSHGPALGYGLYSTDNTITNQELRVGYNVGVGYQLSRHFTAGTYVNPYVSFDKNGVDLLHGRLFIGTLRNIYVAYRF